MTMKITSSHICMEKYIMNQKLIKYFLTYNTLELFLSAISNGYLSIIPTVYKNMIKLKDKNNITYTS